jgi:two-component sensor histidine kinase
MNRLVIKDVPMVRVTGAKSASLRRRWPLSLRLLLGGSIALPLLLLALWADRSWRIENARAEDEARRSAELVREYALGVIRTHGAILEHMTSLVETAERESADAEVLHRRLAALNARHPSVLSLGVISAEGEITVSSRSHPIRLDVSDRDYFRGPRNGDDALQITRLVLRPGGQDVVLLAQRRPDAEFLGVLFATIPVETFTDVFGRLAPENRGSASLLRSDGLLLVRHTSQAPAITIPPDAPFRRAITSAEDGVYRAVAVSDGIQRIYGYTRVDGVPLYANFGVSTAALRTTWARDTAFVAALLALVALLGCAAVTQAARRVQADLDHSLLVEARRRADYQETLLRELHHRVKNSLMTVQSLIMVRGGGPDRDTVLRQRVMALAQVHDLLHISDFVSRLDLGAFLQALCANPAIVPPERGIPVSCRAEQAEINVEDAVPLSLVVVELVTNALKHAFPDGRSGRIEVILVRDAAQAVLTIRDDGIGLPEAKTGRRASGLRLVDRLVAQLRATLEVKSEDGTSFRLTFPLDAA